MALVKNTSLKPLPLRSGAMLARGASANVDTSLEPEATYLAEGRFIVIDGQVAPPAPADPLAERPRKPYVAATAPVSLAAGDLWVDTTTGTLKEKKADGSLSSPLLGSVSAITATSYDSAGNLTSITEGGVTTTYTYDASGNVLTETRGGVTRTFSYDAAGNLSVASVA